MSIGDFARATHLSVKALRHYHEEGLLEPAEVDPFSGYRRYDLAQIPTAQVIHRLRDLDMPLEDIRGVLHTTDLAARSELIARHLRRLEQELSRTQSAVASLRELLEHPASDVPIEHRSIPRMRVAAISQQVTIADVGPWYNGALGELYATLSAQDTVLAGDAGAIYADALFSHERGQATVYLPTNTPFHPTGRVEPLELPASRPRGYRARRPARERHRPRLRGPGRPRYPPRSGRRRANPGVLPGQQAPHRRLLPLADRDRMAHLRDGPPLTDSPLRRPPGAVLRS